MPNAPAHAHKVMFQNTKEWAVAIDLKALQWHGWNDGGEPDLPQPLWAYQAPPGYLTVTACKIDWPVTLGVPAPVPLEGQC